MSGTTAHASTRKDKGKGKAPASTAAPVGSGYNDSRITGLTEEAAVEQARRFNVDDLAHNNNDDSDLFDEDELSESGDSELAVPSLEVDQQDQHLRCVLLDTSSVKSS